MAEMTPPVWRAAYRREVLRCWPDITASSQGNVAPPDGRSQTRVRQIACGAADPSNHPQASAASTAKQESSAGAPGDRQEEKLRILHDERQSEPHRPRVMRVTSRGVGRSVDRGVGGPGIEPRNRYRPGCRRFLRSGRQHGGARYRERLAGPAWSEALARRRNLLFGNREISWLAV
jgi:hypothetical protein